MSTTAPLRTAYVVLMIACGATVPGLAQDSISEPLATQLAGLMADGGLEALAGQDTADDDRFVAALALPGQLMVVSARYAAPAIAATKILNREFRNVYLDLNAASIAGTKILITDSGSDGLGTDNVIDLVNRDGKILRIDDNPGGQQLSRDAYRQAVTDADQEYAHMLRVLLDAARADAGGSAILQESVSATLAAELTSLMAGRQLEALAGKDTIDADRYVAALAMPGQLLVVSARHATPVHLETKIAAGEFREVYLDLNGASLAGTRILITDAGANGLRAMHETVDVVDRGAAGTIRLDGNPSGQRLSRTAYRSAVADADAQYARMLRVLLTAVP